MKREPLTSADAQRGASCSAAISCGVSSEVPRARAEGVRRVLAQRAGRPQLLDAALARVSTDLGVVLGAARADLAHVAEHHPVRAGQAGQQVDRRAHRIGVGVVAVIDQRDARALALPRQQARSSADRNEAIEPLHDRGHRRTDGQGRGRRGQRVVHVVCAGDAQREFGGASRRVRAQHPAVASPGDIGGDVGLAAGRKCELRARAGLRSPDRCLRIVGRKDSHARRR